MDNNQGFQPTFMLPVEKQRLHTSAYLSTLNPVSCHPLTQLLRVSCIKHDNNQNQLPRWVKGELTREYFNTEWGTVELTQEALFEHLCLFVFQTGLTWETVLKHREVLAEALFSYDLEKLASAPDSYLEDFLATPALIQNPRKLAACLTNAKALHDSRIDLAPILIEEYPQPVLIEGTYRDLPQATERTRSIAEKLTGAGFVHVGPVIISSLVQACGMMQVKRPAICR